MTTSQGPIKLDNGNFLKIDIITESIFRIRISSDTIFRESGLERYGILKTDWPDCKCSIYEKPGAKEIITRKASLTVSLRDGRITLKNENEVVLDQNESPVCEYEKGFRVAFKLDDSERLYGLGDETRDCISKRGHKARMVVTNVASYEPIPFVMSTRGWGIFLNTTWYHYADLGEINKNVAAFHSDKGTLDYYVFVGASLRDLLSVYTSIAGRPALLPKWGYGMTWVCDERELRARDMLYEAYEFRRHDIPCDVIGLEPGWMEKSYDFSTDKKWSEERFHIPFWLKNEKNGRFADALRTMGFKLSLWLCCDYDLSEYEEMLVKGKEALSGGPTTDESASLEDNLIKDPHFLPVYMDQITKRGEPWFEHLKQFIDDGASAFKLDGANSVCFHPDRKWINGMVDAEMHNLYPVIYVKQMADGYKDYQNGKRAMLYTATGWAGTQKYAASWAGDTGGGEKTVACLLNLGLSGHSNVCTDMMGDTREEIHYGCFQPLLTGFSWHMYNQPWFKGRELLDIYRFYVRLRYKLIPYIYSTAHEASRTGTPMMRAMSLMWQNDTRTDQCLHQYMLGEWMLVTAFGDDVYLPEGNWIDYWTGEKVQGPADIKVEYPAQRGGGLFIKAGAIIPQQEVCDYIAGTPDKIIWEIFPLGKSSYVLYEDDGETIKHLEGEVAETSFTCEETSEAVNISISQRKGSYDGMPGNRVHELLVHMDTIPSRISGSAQWSYDKEKKTVHITGITEQDGECTIEIKL